MTLPNPTYTWTVTPSQTVAQQGTLEATQKLFWRTFYASLDALTGVSVDYSCNSVTAGTKGDAVNRLVVDADIVGNTPGNAHSWIVFLLHGSLGSLCFDYDSVLGASDISIFHSDSGFTGGTTTARPTASDEREITDNPSGLYTTNGTYTYHVLRATESIRVDIYHTISAVGPSIRFQVEKARFAPVTGWTTPIIARWSRPSSSGSAGNRANWNSTGWAARISGTNRTLLPESSVPFAGLNLDSERPIAAVGLTHASLGPLGLVADFFFVDDAVTDLTSYSDAVGTLGWMTFDEIVEPWNRTTSLSGPAVIGVIQPPLIQSADATAPVVTVVSPTPGVLPGTRAQARLQPITIDVTDVSPGLRSVMLLVSYAGIVGEDVVCRRNTFRAPYTGSVSVITNGFRFVVNPPPGGWPIATENPDIRFFVEAVDAAGNLESP